VPCGFPARGYRLELILGESPARLARHHDPRYGLALIDLDSATS
jgi:hypothetical protein